ncbi:GNAT family N-acetyltransferase [Haloarcula onubensis]|uniref:GNAT family N-acetyltransferase n=1 Tax=Haloarcula onubensis TaxID=2950539 RepID=A0ABU2FTW3_9EURY|nr:GNAT family N-acetyltransferase [Halomicroarcula sp. S3CR25-11]MDS0284202.1 GNAT family N-acetyltransferase [Halomicroarcula sp. S3CR25-11]
MDITTASTELTDRLTDMWVDLARDQRSYGSHLLGPENRTVIRETVVQRIVAGNLLVARRDGRVVGFVMFTVEHGRYEQDVTPGLVENLFVQPAARREGVGSALLGAAEDRLVDDGATVVQLEAMSDNEAAREFYAAHGYTPHRLELEKPTENDTA